MGRYPEIYELNSKKNRNNFWMIVLALLTGWFISRQMLYGYILAAISFVGLIIAFIINLKVRTKLKVAVSKVLPSIIMGSVFTCNMRCAVASYSKRSLTYIVYLPYTVSKQKKKTIKSAIKSAVKNFVLSSECHVRVKLVN